MIRIAPSVLSADFTRLGADLDACVGADWIHFDVMDGCFVPNISFGIPVLKSVRNYSKLPLDVHLMIDKPARYIEDFAAAGADLISVHLEADGPAGIRRALDEMDRCGVKKGIALRPITSPEAILPYIEELDLVLVMTVEPGFGGQPFMESQLATIRRVREIIDRVRPDCGLEVDGGINSTTAAQAVSAGANVLVAGSAVFHSDHPAAAITALRCAGEV